MKQIFCSTTARLTIAAAVLASLASASVWDKKTEVTFGQPVELPGRVVLPSGEYVMKLLDSPSQRHIVQVFNKEQNHVYATVIAIPTQRMEPADKTIITFYETPQDQPMFIRHWFYPGDTIGQEFVYPKDRAHYISSTSGTSVPSMREPVAGNQDLIERTTPSLPTGTAAEPEPVREDSSLVALAEPAPAPAPAPVVEAEPEPAPAAQDPPSTPSVESKPAQDNAVQQRSSLPESLPSTAGSSYAIAMGGMLLLAAGLLMKTVR